MDQSFDPELIGGHHTGDASSHLTPPSIEKTVTKCVAFLGMLRCTHVYNIHSFFF